MKQKVVVFWFRRDLRIHDNTGLYHALMHGLPVLPVFIFDTKILSKLECKTDNRVLFIHQKLNEINNKFNAYGSSLQVFHDDPERAWMLITDTYSVSAVFANEDYEPYALKRDGKIMDFLNKKNIPFRLFKDQVIFNPAEIMKDDGKAYTIYTPYKNKWRATLSQDQLERYPSEDHLKKLIKTTYLPVLSLKLLGFENSGMQFPSLKLNQTIIENYHLQRDFPALAGTSRISVHLRFGTVSIRELVPMALDLSETWINELIWREFYMMILFHFPYVVEQAFKPVYDRLIWRNDQKEFFSWCNGQTGYPIVDAGMRELNETGFMHNRLRMITASFLTKHLLVDWKWGEAYFASKLLDYELASNNGGWQWAAGTGCDAAPYFRIFSPDEQTRKFDPQFRYIRKWVPEFEDFSYPKPIINHKLARERCLKMYKGVLSQEY